MKKKEDKKIKKIIYILIVMLLFSSIFINVILLTKNNVIIYKNDENIVFFGDSITEQYKIEKYYPRRNVINSGIGGNKSEDLIDRIESDVYKYNPSKLFLLIGINDICSYVEKEDLLYNIQVLINGIKTNRKNTELYVESIYPINHDKLDKEDLNYCKEIDNKKIKEINEEIEKISIESDVTYIDVYNKLIDKNGELKQLYTKEGLHLNNLGYLKVTSVLNEYIEK